MKTSSWMIRLAFAAFVVAGGAAGLSGAAWAQGAAQSSATAPQDGLLKYATHQLDKKQFRGVKLSIDNGVATLTGTVDLYGYKADAERRMKGVKGISVVQNQIVVGGPTVPDDKLQNKLSQDLAFDRVGYWNVFNAMGVTISGGVATLAGHARTDVDLDSAVTLISYTPGVKGLINTVAVDPVSHMDDTTRFAVMRAVYGYPTLNRYAINPAKPIRISVQNGNVELYGVVDTEADSQIAGMRANTVGGVFSVKNYLIVANDSKIRKE